LALFFSLHAGSLSAIATISYLSRISYFSRDNTKLMSLENANFE